MPTLPSAIHGRVFMPQTSTILHTLAAIAALAAALPPAHAQVETPRQKAIREFFDGKAALPVPPDAGGARILIVGDGIPDDKANPMDAPAIRIEIGGGGQLIFVPAQTPAQALELPVVSEGFASDQDIKGPITPLVRALEAATYHERENATEALLRLPPARLADVVAALKAEKDEEAVSRLTDVAAHLYLKPRTYLKARPSVLGVWSAGHEPALLGLKFEPQKARVKPGEEETMTVLVTEIQAGFPARQTLREGDRIVAIAGKGFPGEMSNDGFRERIAALWPGVPVPMLVLRDGKMLELPVQTTCVPLSKPDLSSFDVSMEISNMVAARQMAVTAFLESITGKKDQASARGATGGAPNSWGDNVLIPVPDGFVPRQ
jgi:hypothetical protein